MGLLELYCHVDDFWQGFASHWEQGQLQSGETCRRRNGQLCASEIMTILIYFHIFRQRDFKTFYTQFVQLQLRGEFPNLVSYNRFVELMPSVLVPLCAYLRYCYGSHPIISTKQNYREWARHVVYDFMSVISATKTCGTSLYAIAAAYRVEQ